MIIALWILTILLTVAFLGAGIMKATRAKTKLIESGMGYAEDFSAGAVKLIGIAEVVGALGLVLPLATGIVPVLSPIAATALAVLMVGAVVVHVRRKETIVPALVLALLSAATAVLGFLTLG